ncbi:S-layer homology domain-containing protein [Cohnella nanjingensis]|uniref:S-layer homology domain-containing protein n=1 Tax=Cohnella nanjingensis TaxID=1387779 RepID=A0A7X0RP92_9BACL|nr:S-layer homology domain-containing protein [Cohnella nanjingensis]MBB6671090.1 S-layer homology domain-containing protein [Cohnella nanjingensis]
MKNKSKWTIAGLSVVLASTLMSGSVFAFGDIDKDAGRTHILHLQELGIVRGDGSGQFKPKSQVTASTAVTMLVNGFKLNIDNIRFIKEPKASDYYTHIKDDAPYAQAFIIAQLNGLEIPKDIQPGASVTREQFAHWLFQAISTKGDYAWTMQYVLLNDEKSVAKDYMESIQKLVIANIASLDAKQNFRPQAAITRSEAAVMLDKALSFVEKTKPIEQLPEPTPLGDVQLTTEAYSADVKKVTLSAEVGHPGYGIEIAGIDFKDKQATIRYRVVEPDPDKMFPQVVTTVKASVYIDASYTPVLGGQEGVSTPPAKGGAASGSTGFPIVE